MKTILLLDPYVSTDYLIKSLKQLGFFTIVLRVNQAHRSADKLAQLGFDHIIDSSHQLADDVKAIKTFIAKNELDLTFVLGGCDDVSIYAEKVLAALLPQYANSPLADLRTQKFEMLEFLKKKGLTHIQQTTITQANHLDKRHELRHFHYPIIVKPNRFGSGQEGICVYDSYQQLVDNLSQQMQQKHSNSQSNFCEFVAQEFLPGQEIVIDTVSVAGKHHIAGVLFYIKEDLVYREISPANFCQKDQQALIDYSRQVLDAIDFQNGLNHIELLFSPTGIELIEVNPRMSGAHGSIQEVDRVHSGYNQIELLLSLLAGHQPTCRKLSKRHGRGIVLYSRTDDMQQEIKQKLPSLACSEKSVLYVDPVKREACLDFHAAYAIVFIADNDARNVDKDTAFLRHFDHQQWVTGAA